MGIKQGIEQGVERGVKNTQIKIAIKMLVRNNQTLEEISEIVGLDLDALRELKKSIWLNGCVITSILYKVWGDVKVCRALDEMFEESTNKGIQMGIKQGIERGVKNTQIKIAIKMLVRNNQTLEEISEIVGLDLDALRELKKSIWLNGCVITSILYKVWGDVKVCRALDEMFEESTNKGIQMGIKHSIALNQFEVYQTMLDKGFNVKLSHQSLQWMKNWLESLWWNSSDRGTDIRILIFLIEI